MSPPITENQAHTAKKWMQDNFGDSLKTALQDSPFDINIVCAIAGKEAACYWLSWVAKGMAAKDILARCVFDASGDAPHTSRSAFPRNTAAFRARMGEALTAALIEQANETRALRGLHAAQWVYKGYGIFQYDLQFILGDSAFFENKLWGNFDECLNRAMTELSANYRIYKDIRESVRAYNGSGAAAEEYADDVMTIAAWCAEV